MMAPFAGRLTHWLAGIAGLAVLGFMIVTLPARVHAQGKQVGDDGYVVVNPNPAYEPGKGPAILFSTQHSAFVANGSHTPLARLAESDGFSTRLQTGPLVEELKGPDTPAVLVIINAHLASYRDHSVLEPPSAFTQDEIEAIKAWVEGGGGLLMLADHAPLGGGESDLAAAFGFTFLNGYAADAQYADAGVQKFDLDFTPGTGLETASPVTDGGTGRKPITHFHTFGGQAFIPPEGATTLLSIPDGWTMLFTYDMPGGLTNAPRMDAGGMAQGAILESGKGRVAVFAETGGFSAQIMDPNREILKEPRKIGFNTPAGADNPEFILSVLRWLAGYRADN